MDDKLKSYPKTDILKVIDTIGVPHPYCITPKHVAYASDHFCGLLSKDAIIQSEKHGAKCGICHGKLSYEEHETALLVEVNHKAELKDVPGLKDYLLSIKAKCESDGFAGFAFKQA